VSGEENTAAYEREDQHGNQADPTPTMRDSRESQPETRWPSSRRLTKFSLETPLELPLEGIPRLWWPERHVQSVGNLGKLREKVGRRDDISAFLQRRPIGVEHLRPLFFIRHR
jgi:hypothetical protein